MIRVAPLIVAVLGALTAVPAAACYADYKAKRPDPLQLHYGVIDLPESDCQGKEDARDAIARRVGADDWTVLTVMSLFGESGLAGRRESAGEFYLRY